MPTAWQQTDALGVQVDNKSTAMNEEQRTVSGSALANEGMKSQYPAQCIPSPIPRAIRDARWDR